MQTQQKPGIDVTRLCAGNLVIVETADAVYEISIKEPARCYALIRSTRMRQEALGLILGSSQDMAGERMSVGWIGEGLFLNIQFKFERHVSTSIVSAAVNGTADGKAWHYEVF